MDKTSSHDSPDSPVAPQSRVWVGPLVAGCCFALGYGITHRVLTLQTNALDPAPEAFTPLAFPGDSLKEIRSRFSDDDASLQVDVAAIEAAEAASRPPKPVAKTMIKPDLALQAPQPPAWTAPAWSDPQTTAPAPTPEVAEDDAPFASAAQESEDINTEPGSLPLPEPSEVVPAVAIPADDSALLVAEPDPVLVPPGAEAFFETMEPVIPPQP